MKADQFDGFTVNIFQDDLGRYIARLVELPTISAHGKTPHTSLKELKIAWELAKESYIEDGEEIPQAPSKRDYSGQFNVRVDKRVHRLLAMEAARNGVSLNALVSQKLSDTVRHP